MDELDEPIENQEEFTAIMMVRNSLIPQLIVIVCVLLGIWSFLCTVRPHHLQEEH